MESDEKSNFFSSRAMLTFCKPNQSPEAPNTQQILRKGIPLREGRGRKILLKRGIMMNQFPICGSLNSFCRAALSNAHWAYFCNFKPLCVARCWFRFPKNTKNLFFVNPDGKTRHRWWKLDSNEPYLCGQLSETERLSRSGFGLLQVFNYVSRQSIACWACFWTLGHKHHQPNLSEFQENRCTLRLNQRPLWRSVLNTCVTSVCHA